jgi:hypothetical protein
MEGTVWKGFVQTPFNQPLELRDITSPTSAELRYTTVPYVYHNKGGNLVEGVNFHFEDDNDDSPPSSSTRIELNGVFVSGDRIEGDAEWHDGEFHYWNFYLERQ